MEGNLKQAEHHYIEGGAWNYAVDMYRAHDMWDESLRVAKSNGTKKELGEVAIKIAEIMGTDRGTQFLIKNGLIEAAIDFEANQEKFDDAFKLAENHARYKLPDVHLKYALYLEDDNRFKEAEDEFIKANKPQEAINMYEHKGDWHSAIQVARQYHPESVQRVQLKQAMSFQQKSDFNKAEQCYLAAKEPEKAIQMYQENQMFGEAMRVAQKHAPHLVDQINEGYSRPNQTQNQSGQEILSSAKIWEEQREYGKAIDRYLEITDRHFQNKDTLEEIWNTAFNLAMNFAKNKVNDVVNILGPRLCMIQKFESAAEIYEAVTYYEKAIEAWLEVKKWDRAMEVAQQVRPMEMKNVWVNKIQQKKKESYVASGKISKIVEGGDLSGLELLAQEGRWEECLEIAAKQNENILNKFLAQFARQYISQGQFKETARVLSRYNSPAFQEMLPVYKTIAQDVLASVNEVELQILREMLQKLVKNLEGFQVDKSSPIYQEFFRFLTISHLLLLKSECARNNLDQVSARLCTSMLRYCKDIRADKAFLDAGEANKKIGSNDMAFIFFNRYIDLWDAIVDPDGNMIQENTDFEGTDIPVPYEIPLPEKNLLSEPERD